ncbi:MAG: glycosyltransferase family 39 protein [Anaerolineae bacterium]|nr:glycosyltransferase family 39 protein [Anaerolineae bacterium]
MYQRLGRGIPGWGLVLLLTLPAIHPLLRAELPRGGDTGLHLYRLVELDHCLRQGLLFPRWMPDLVYGYGYPLFNFYAPLSTYLTEALHLLGLAFVPALRAGFILCLLGSGLAMYLFAREVFGERAALVAAVAYVYAPYLLYNHYVRGSLSDALAFVWFPLVFWTLHRVALKGEGRYIALGAVTYAALVLTHNVSSLATTPVLLLYLIALWMWRRRAFPWRAVLAALLLGLALSAFFWLPALAEKQFTRIELFMAAPEYDYRLNFLTLGELLGPPSPVDTGCMNPDIPIQIGLVQTVFGALAIVLLGRLQGEQRWSVITFALAVMGLGFMTLSPSEWLWARLPLIRYFEFPWRLLSPATFALALLVGGALAALEKTFARQWVSSGVVGLAAVVFFVASVPSLYPRYSPSQTPNPTLADVTAFQQQSHALGVTSAGEYVPRWAVDPPRKPAFPGMDEGAPLSAKVDSSSLPPGATITSLLEHPTAARWRVFAAEDWALTVLTFYFPGWHATIDGQPVPVEATGPQGLIRLAVSAGEHLVTLRFSETPVRLLGDGLSAAALVVVLALSAMAWRRTGHPWTAPARLRWREGGILALLGGVLLLVKVVYLDRYDTPLKWGFDGQQVRGMQHSAPVELGAGVTLLGYDLSRTVVRPGETLPVTLYWKTAQPLTVDYSAFAHVVAPDFYVLTQQDNAHPGYYPTTRWGTDEYNRDVHPIPIPVDMPPGIYQLAVGMYNPFTGERLPVLSDVPGAEVGAVLIGPVQVIP